MDTLTKSAVQKMMRNRCNEITCKLFFIGILLYSFRKNTLCMKLITRYQLFKFIIEATMINCTINSQTLCELKNIPALLFSFRSKTQFKPLNIL
jgi:hypothetical protein